MRHNLGRATEEVGAWGQLAHGRSAVGYPRGSIIYTPQQPAGELMLLSSGQFGQIALAEAGPYDTFAEALAPVTAYRIPRGDALSLIERDPALGLALLEDLARHRQAVSHLFDEVAFKSVPARLATLLLDMAQSDGSAEPSRLPHRSHRQLGERINAYRETVTRVINRFRAARLLEIDRSFITLINPRGLEELAQG